MRHWIVSLAFVVITIGGAGLINSGYTPGHFTRHGSHNCPTANSCHPQT